MASKHLCLLAVVLVVWTGCAPTPTAPAVGDGPALVAESAALLASAREAYLAGNYLTATDLFAQAWAADDDSFEAVEGLVRSYQALGEVRTLVHQLWSRAESRPPRATQEYAMGLAQRLMSKFEDGLRHLNAALELAPGNPWVLYARGDLLRAAGNDEEARRDFQQVLRHDAQRGPGLAALAILAFRRDHNEEDAIRLLSEAVEHFRPLERSQQVAAHVFLGGIYARRGENERALEQFRAARSLDPTSTYDLINLGDFLARIGRREEAEQEWDATVRELGADSPTGLDVLRARRERAGDLIDLTHALGQAPPSDYAALIANIGSPERLPALPVDEVLRPYVPPNRDVLVDGSEDLDGDGQRERLVVDAVQSDEFLDQFLIRGAVLRIFSADSTDPYVFATRFDHFYKLAVRDLDADGRREALVVGFRDPNRLAVAVLTKIGRSYAPVLMADVRCSTPWAGCLVSDLDGDGSREMLFISGEDGWVDVYRWRGSRAERANQDFPEFYTAFLRRWGDASAAVLAARPGLEQKIRQARSYRRPWQQ